MSHYESDVFRISKSGGKYMAEPLSTAITGGKAIATAISLAKQAKDVGLWDKLKRTFKKKHKVWCWVLPGLAKVN